MNKGKPIRVGLMGFGQTGRQIYELASRSDDVEVVAIADIGDPAILHYLLCAEVDDSARHTLEGNFLTNEKFSARMMPILAACWSWVPWLKLSLKVSAPARNRARIMSALLLAGPKVATILALR